MKATWQGYIALGRLGVPVRLYTATHSLLPKFVQLHVFDNSPIQRTLECKAEQRPIPYDEVIRGVEYTPGRYIPLTERELEQASPTAVKAISIRQFCDTDAITPQYYDKPYYVVPMRGGERAYALIREVFARSRKMAIAQLELHNKAYVSALRVEGDILMLMLLRYADEIVPRSSIKSLPLSKPSPDEVEALTDVVERFDSPFYIEDYHDQHAEFLQELVERKAKGLPMRRPERKKPEATAENDIVPALKDTLQEQRMISSGEASEERA